MLVVLAVVFLVLPIAELYVIVQVAQGVGILNTIGLLVLVSVAGAWLCKREGLGVLRRIRASLDRYELPGNELVDGRADPVRRRADAHARLRHRLRRPAPPPAAHPAAGAPRRGAGAATADAGLRRAAPGPRGVIRDAATVAVVRDGDGGLEVLLLRRTSRAVFVPGAYVFPGGAADPEDGGDFRVTAAREAFEEAGLRLDPASLRPIGRWLTPPGQPRRFDTRFFVAAAPPEQVAACDGHETVECGWWPPAAALDAGLLLIEPTRFTLGWLAGFDAVAAALAAPPYHAAEAVS